MKTKNVKNRKNFKKMKLNYQKNLKCVIINLYLLFVLVAQQGLERDPPKIEVGSSNLLGDAIIAHKSQKLF